MVPHVVLHLGNENGLSRSILVKSFDNLRNCGQFWDNVSRQQIYSLSAFQLRFNIRRKKVFRIGEKIHKPKCLTDGHED